MPTNGSDKRTIKALRARDGFTVIELLFVMGILFIISVIAIPAYVKFIQKARETAVVAYMDKVKKAEEMYRLQNPSNVYSGSFDELETTGLIAPANGAASRVEHEYTFSLTSGINGGEPYWAVNANPLSSNPAARWFYSDNAGAVRYKQGSAADSGSQEYVY